MFLNFKKFSKELSDLASFTVILHQMRSRPPEKKGCNLLDTILVSNQKMKNCKSMKISISQWTTRRHGETMQRKSVNS